MREWSYDGAVHDDALDAVAGCLRSEPVRIPAAGISAKIFAKPLAGTKQSVSGNNRV